MPTGVSKNQPGFGETAKGGKSGKLRSDADALKSPEGVDMTGRKGSKKGKKRSKR